jgi:endonuclease/exonuclease/phosphatase family metal-dependent hydrolase
MFAGKRVRLRARIATPRFAFLAAEPTYTNNSTITYCEGYEYPFNMEYDGFVPSDCTHLYVFAYNSAAAEGQTDRTPYAETRIPAISSGAKAKFRVIQWNIGGFSKGASYESTYDQHPEEYAADLPVWKQTINDMDADILCCCEYNDVMKKGTNGASDVIARDEIFSLYENAYIKPKPSATSYMQTAIFSHLAAKSSVKTEYVNTVQAGRYYEVNRYTIDGHDVWVIATHLDWNQGEHGADYRQEQMEALMAFAADKTHVIICGDFNVGAGTDETARQNGSLEFDQWASAGFKMANHGYLGDFNTGHSTYSVLDNIIVKGFDVSNIKVYDGDNAKNVSQEQTHQLSDHAAIGCTLTML